MENIKIYKTAEEAAKGAAEYINNKLSGGGERFNIALSGGSTPKLLFRILAADYKEKIDWKRVHFFWSDERCVSPEDPESNYGEFKRIYLNNMNLPAGNIHRIRGENEPAAEAARYAEEIILNVKQGKKGLPEFDLILLGMGSDGHTASLFPGAELKDTVRNTAGNAEHPGTGQIRVSLTLDLINAAKECAFLVTGSDKAETAAEVLAGAKKYPAALVQPGKLIWFMDEGAASLIKFL